jgi:biopolymer transport protein ExbD
VQLTIDATGKVFVDQAVLAGENLETKLKSMMKEGESINVQLRADETVPYSNIAKVMAAVNRAGVTKLSFITSPQEQHDRN